MLVFMNSIVALISCVRSYPAESTRALQHSEVKLPREGSVLGWGTTREAPLLYTFFALAMHFFPARFKHHLLIPMTP